MMTYEEFKSQVLSNIKDYLEPGNEYFISIGTVYKNNEVLDGLRIIPQGRDSNVSPTIYLNGIYREFSENPASGGIEEVFRSIAETYEKHRIDNDRLDISSLMDFDAVKDRIFPKIMGIEGNEELLKDKPYRQVEDMACVYYVDVGQMISMDGKATVTITNDLLEKYGITPEQLDYLALKNQAEKMEPSIIGLGSMLSSMLAGDETGLFLGPDEGAVQMYVVTNKDRLQGASIMLDTDFMDSVTEKIGECYILPSSVHEVLVIPKESVPGYYELESMVKEVNSTCVAPEDKLTDHVYSYDPRVKEIYRADKEAEHRENVESMEESMGRRAAGR